MDGQFTVHLVTIDTNFRNTGPKIEIIRSIPKIELSPVITNTPLMKFSSDGQLFALQFPNHNEIYIYERTRPGLNLDFNVIELGNGLLSRAIDLFNLKYYYLLVETNGHLTFMRELKPTAPRCDGLTRIKSFYLPPPPDYDIIAAQQTLSPSPKDITTNDIEHFNQLPSWNPTAPFVTTDGPFSTFDFDYGHFMHYHGPCTYPAGFMYLYGLLYMITGYGSLQIFQSKPLTIDTDLTRWRGYVFSFLFVNFLAITFARGLYTPFLCWYFYTFPIILYMAGLPFTYITVYWVAHEVLFRFFKDLSTEMYGTYIYHIINISVVIRVILLNRSNIIYSLIDKLKKT
eukprot:gene7395-8643_t